MSEAPGSGPGAAVGRREELAALVVARLDRDARALRAAFDAGPVGPDGPEVARHLVVDDLFPDDVAHEIAAALPDPEDLRLLRTFREHKRTSKDLDRFDPLVADATFALQAPRVIAAVAALTGIDGMTGDPHLYAGGISAMGRGAFLNPHVDNSHDHDRRRYRVLNLLWYATPGWEAAWGGNLRLWDDAVRRPVEVACRFNRLVVMATDRRSWHSVSPVTVDDQRWCLSNYFFAEAAPAGTTGSHVTRYRGRPDQPVIRAVSRLDDVARSALRRLVPGGVGRQDLYEGPTEP